MSDVYTLLIPSLSPPQAFLEEMRAHPDISATEQSQAKASSSAAHKAVGGHNIVSITGNLGRGVTEEALQQLSSMRVGRKALEMPHVYMERLVYWLQNVIHLTSDVLIHLSDAVCDFVRDEQGNWWLLQLKGFRISPLSAQRCMDWHNERAFGLNRAKRSTPAEQRAKLDAERGYVQRAVRDVCDACVSCVMCSNPARPCCYPALPATSANCAGSTSRRGRRWTWKTRAAATTVSPSTPSPHTATSFLGVWHAASAKYTATPTSHLPNSAGRC